jgi:hypothetical protein
MWSVAIVPLSAFLIASNNPSAWAIISGGSLWIALVGYFESHGRRKVLLGALSTLMAVVGAGARADAAVYVVIAIVAAVVVTFTRTRRYLLDCILPMVLALLAFIFYRIAGQNASVSFGLNSNHVGAATGAGTGIGTGANIIWNNLLELPSLWAGSLGTWPLGWLDTPVPAVVWAGCMFVFAAVTFAGLVSLTRRKVLALALILGALIAVPSWILFQSRALVGQEVQPRYILPLLIMFGGLMLLQVGSRRIGFTRVQMWVVAVILAMANGAALFTNLRRYVTGLSNGGIDLDHGVQWWWNTPISPMVVLLIGTITFGVAIVIALREVTNESVGWSKETHHGPLDTSPTRRTHPLGH